MATGIRASSKSVDLDETILVEVGLEGVPGLAFHIEAELVVAHFQALRLGA